jgi:prephenate dehydrogenase
VAIVGLGLIGGSLGLALKKKMGKDVHIVGYSRRPETTAKAKDRAIVDAAALDLGGAVSGADVVIIATPVLTIKEVLQDIAPHVDTGCVVSDIGSTKRRVLEWAEEALPEGVDFVGGHPMAGKETSGVDHADGGLFEGCVYCLVPSSRASEAAVDTMEELAVTVGARPMRIDAESHDGLVAGVSHLPLLLSSALMSCTAESETWPGMAGLAASGYRDMTRLASGDPELSRDISLTNSDEIAEWLDRYMDKLAEYRRLLEMGSDELIEEFSRAQAARAEWLRGEY